MNIPKKLNYKYGIKLSAKPILFGYKHSSNAIENFNLLEGKMAELQLAHVSEVSRLRVVPQDEWKQNGFFIVEHDGYKVVIQRFDVTQVKLDKQDSDAKAIEDSTVDTQAEFKDALSIAMSRIEELESKLSSNASNKNEAEKQKKEADDKELAENLEGADIDISSMSKAVEDSKTKKPSPTRKPSKKRGGLKVG